MKLTVSLVFLIAMFVKGAQAVSVSFLVDMLKPDLDVILKYNEKRENITRAYIHWPNSITFEVYEVPLIEGTKFLKIEGQFWYDELFSLAHYDLFYGNKKFYFRRGTGNMTSVRPEKAISFKQGIITEKAVHYLSIKYFSLEEMQHSIKSYYNANKPHFEDVLYDNPAIFLYSLPKCEGHFIEYIFNSTVLYPKVPEGALQALIGLQSYKKLKLRENKNAYRLVFDQKTETLRIPKALNVHSAPIPDVYGVRMATVGYMAEVQGSRVKMINTKDLHADSVIPEKHVVPDDDFMEKVKIVEPRLNYPNAKLPTHRLLNEAMFQVKGHIFKKKINYLSNGTIDTKCPMLIKNESGAVHKSFKGRVASKLCTDETQFWLHEEN